MQIDQILYPDMHICMGQRLGVVVVIGWVRLILRKESSFVSELAYNAAELLGAEYTKSGPPSCRNEGLFV